MESLLYLYGVVPAGIRSLIRQPGVSGHRRFDVVERGQVGVLVSELSSVPDGKPNDLRAHLAVLEEVVAESTVLPMRFGVVLSSREDVEETLLRPWEEQLTAMLRQFEGLVEMTVRSYYAEEPALREVMAERPDIRGLSERTRSMTPGASYYERIQ